MRRRAAARWARATARWLRAPAVERRSALRVLLLWAGAEGALCLLPLPTVCRIFGVCLMPSSTMVATSSAPPSAEIDPFEIEERGRRTRRQVERVLRTARPEDACLRRSLVIGHLLRDLRPVLRIGVARSAAGFGAHAWLEVGQVVVAEPAGARRAFVPLRRLG